MKLKTAFTHSRNKIHNILKTYTNILTIKVWENTVDEKWRRLQCDERG